MKKTLALLLFVPLFHSVFAQLHSNLWSEFWQMYSYRTTNFAGASSSRPEENFHILTTALRAGKRFYLSDESNKSNSFWGYDVFLRAENVVDFSNKKPFHDNIYNNHNKFGIGHKLRYQLVPKSEKNFLSYFHIDMIMEYLILSTFHNDLKTQLNNIEDEDFRFGINGWLNGEFFQGSNEKLFLLYEIYYDIAYRKTTFAEPKEYHHAVSTLAPRFFTRITTEKGFVGPFLDAYVSGEFINDLIQKENWNKNPYINNQKFFLGARGHIPISSGEGFFESFSLMVFFEKGFVNWSMNPHNWQLADQDLRLGFIIWFPLGEARFRPFGMQNPF